MYLSFENQLSFIPFFSCHHLLNFLLITTGDFHPLLLKWGQRKGQVAQHISWGQSPIGYTYNLSGHSVQHFLCLVQNLTHYGSQYVLCNVLYKLLSRIFFFPSSANKLLEHLVTSLKKKINEQFCHLHIKFKKKSKP